MQHGQAQQDRVCSWVVADRDSLVHSEAASECTLTDSEQQLTDRLSLLPEAAFRLGTLTELAPEYPDRDRETAF